MTSDDHTRASSKLNSKSNSLGIVHDDARALLFPYGGRCTRRGIGPRMAPERKCHWCRLPGTALEGRSHPTTGTGLGIVGELRSISCWETVDGRIRHGKGA